MKLKYISRICLMALMGLTLFACSDNNSFVAEELFSMEPDENGMYHYQLDLDCNMPSNDEATTRGVVKSWDDDASIIVRFKINTDLIMGIATYHAKKENWEIKTNAALPLIEGEGSCELYYFKDAAQIEDFSVTMTENTACYYSESGIFFHPKEQSITIKATLNRKMWRMRFEGKAGTSITLHKEYNDMVFYNEFDGLTASFTKSPRTVSLYAKENGYTSYLYGIFEDNTSNHLLTVTNGSQTYQRTMISTDLTNGESAYMKIPTADSHNGWAEITPDDNVDYDATIDLDLDKTLVFTDGIVMEFNIGSSVQYFTYDCFPKSDIDHLTEAELADKIYANSTSDYEASNADDLFRMTGSQYFNPDEEYYLCALAENNEGKRGPVLRHLFKTRPKDLPYASISNVSKYSSTSWKFDIYLQNKAKAFYLVATNSSDIYFDNEHWLAYWAYFIQPTKYDQVGTYSSTFNSSSTGYISICTWAIYGNDQIGDYRVEKASIYSSVKSMYPTSENCYKDYISKEELKNIRENMVIYKVEP